MSKVIVVDRIEERLTLARANGADQVLDNSQTPLAEQLDGLRPTLIIDAAYHPSILPEVMALASIRAPCAQSLLPLWRRLTTTIGPSAHRQRAAMAAASSRQRSVHLRPLVIAPSAASWDGLYPFSARIRQKSGVCRRPHLRLIVQKPVLWLLLTKRIVSNVDFLCHHRR